MPHICRRNRRDCHDFVKFHTPSPARWFAQPESYCRWQHRCLCRSDSRDRHRRCQRHRHLKRAAKTRAARILAEHAAPPAHSSRNRNGFAHTGTQPDTNRSFRAGVPDATAHGDRHRDGRAHKYPAICSACATNGDAGTAATKATKAEAQTRTSARTRIGTPARGRAAARTRDASAATNPPAPPPHTPATPPAPNPNQYHAGAGGLFSRG
jgi:hypothetical protein